MTNDDVYVPTTCVRAYGSTADARTKQDDGYNANYGNNYNSSYKTDDRPSGTFHDLEDSIRAMDDRPSMERELAELREKRMQLETALAEIWRQFQLRKNRDAVLLSSDMAEIARTALGAEKSVPCQSFEDWSKEYDKGEK